MSLVLKDRVRETATVVGTGDAALLGAVTGFQSFSVVGNTNTCYYAIADQSGGNWEVGIGTYSTTGPTLARTTVLASSNSGSKVSFTGGTKDVFLTYPSEKAVYLDESDVLNVVTIDTTNIEVTNIKAKDGTAAITLADSTGVATFTANPILNGATANGVAYLNGSKVLTTGSALTFDGQILLVNATQGTLTVGNGTAGYPSVININGGTSGANGPVLFGLGAGSNEWLISSLRSITGGGAKGLADYVYGDFPRVFYINGSEQMRLTSTGLGIGTSSPTSKLSFGANIGFDFATYEGAGGANKYGIGMGGAGVVGNPYRTKLYANGSEQMCIDSNGNVGIGTSSPTTKFQVSGSSFLVGDIVNTGTTQPDSAGWRATNGSVQVYLSAYSYGGAAELNVASNHPVLFKTNNTERMRIDSSGNVGIGTSSPGYKLHVNGGNAAFINSSASTAYFGTGFGSNQYGWVQFNSSGPAMRIGSDQAVSLQVVTSNNTVATFDTSGNLGLGVTPSAWNSIYRALDIGNSTALLNVSTTLQSDIWNNSYYAANLTPYYKNNGYASVFRQINGQFQFYTAPSGTAGNAISFTQAMTLDASGNLSLNPSSTNHGYVVNDGTVNGIMYCSASSWQSVGTTTNHPLAFITNNTERMRIDSSGEVYIAGTTDQGAYNLQCNGTGVWGAGAYVNGSDARLKENVTTLDNSLGLINAMRPVTFTYKEDYSKDRAVQTGFIAQELQEVLAGKDYLDGIVQAGPEHLNVAYQNLIPLLVKAVQELTARVAQLEGN